MESFVFTRQLYNGLRRLQSHIVLKKWLAWWQRRNGPLTPDDIVEFHYLVHRLLFNGEAKFSVDLFEHRWASRRRARFMRMLRECPYIIVVKPPCWRDGHKRCTTYALHGLPGLIKVREAQDESVDVPAHTVIPYWRVSSSYSYVHIVPEQWFTDLADSWREYCLTHGYELTYDHIGDTHFGGPTLHACDSAVLPSFVDWSTFTGSEESRRWAQRALYSLSAGGFARVCRRIYGRLYHPLVNLCKFLRRRLRFRYKDGVVPVGEVDMSCTYWCILVSMLPECAEKKELMSILSTGDFYTELNAACTVPYASRAEVKPEVQKQCLFWKVWHHMEEKSRPLWFALCRRFPRLAAMIDKMRRRMNGTALSEVLTRRESAFFVDRMLPLVHSLGMPVMTIHDCLVVPRSETQRVKDLCGQEALAFFGFVPKFGVV